MFFGGLLAACLVVAHAQLVRERRTVWGECVVPAAGDTNTGFYFYVNTERPSIIGAWSLSVSDGASSFLYNSSLSTATTNVTDPSCDGPQPYWYVWGPIFLPVGDFTHQFLDIGGGDGFATATPIVTQGGSFARPISIPIC